MRALLSRLLKDLSTQYAAETAHYNETDTRLNSRPGKTSAFSFRTVNYKRSTARQGRSPLYMGCGYSHPSCPARPHILPVAERRPENEALFPTSRRGTYSAAKSYERLGVFRLFVYEQRVSFTSSAIHCKKNNIVFLTRTPIGPQQKIVIYLQSRYF